MIIVSYLPSFFWFVTQCRRSLPEKTGLPPRVLPICWYPHTAPRRCHSSRCVAPPRATHVSPNAHHTASSPPTSEPRRIFLLARLDAPRRPSYSRTLARPSTLTPRAHPHRFPRHVRTLPGGRPKTGDRCCWRGPTPSPASPRRAPTSSPTPRRRSPSPPPVAAASAAPVAVLARQRLAAAR